MRRLIQGQAGITLLEMTVVAGIMTVMAGMVALSVTGRTDQSRQTTQIVDVSLVQTAVDTFSGEHPRGRYPTLNGCIGDLVLDTVTSLCVESSKLTDPTKVNSDNLAFIFFEGSSGLDLNKDGDTDDDIKVAPIIWEKAFGSNGSTRRFVPNYLARHPKHAYEFLGLGTANDTSWRDGFNLDPDGLGNFDANTIRAPEGVGSGSNKVDVDILQVPVWGIAVIEGTAIVVNILPEGRY